jgi:hypothetical protein
MNFYIMYCNFRWSLLTLFKQFMNNRNGSYKREGFSMAKTIKECSKRLLYPVIAVIMVLSLLLAPAAAPPVSAAEVNSEWGKADTPNMDDWTIAPGSDAYMPALAIDGQTIYVIGSMWEDENGDGWVNYTEETARLWKSEHGGVTWDDITDNVMKAIRDEVAGFDATTPWVDMVASFNFITLPLDDPNFVVLAAYLGNIINPPWEQVVLVSTDGGENFGLLPHPIQDTSTGTNITDILNMNVGPAVDGVHNIAVSGIEDPDRSVTASITGLPNGDERGRVYRFQTGALVGGWEDAATGVPGWINCTAVTWVYFSTGFARDYTILALTHNTNITITGAITAACAADNNTYLQTGTWSGSNVNWNEAAGRGEAALLTTEPAVWWLTKASTAGITLPLDYDGRDANSRCAWAYVNVVAGIQQNTVGTIYRVVNGDAEPIIQQIPGQPWLAMVFYWGSLQEGKAIAGLLGDGQAPGYSVYNPITHETRWHGILDVPTLAFDLRTGCCEGVQVYRNDGISDMDICCQQWQPACKPPTGHGGAVTIIAPPTGAKAYCLTTGLTTGMASDMVFKSKSPCRNLHMLDKYDEGAFSVSFDDGDTWNQIGLIDTDIDYLTDVAQSPDCNITYLASVNRNLPRERIEGGAPPGKYVECGECDSVFFKAKDLSKELYQAAGYDDKWFRVWNGELTNNTELNGADTPQIGLIRLAPEETTDINTVYFVDRGSDTVYYDDNKGLGCWEEGTSTVDEISDLAVQDEATIYALGFDAEVAVSDDHGSAASWSNTMDSKVDNGHTIAVLGEGNVLVGGEDGKVSYSDSDLATFLDGEANFTKLEDGLGSGNVHVAFDSYFDTNSVVYAAVGQESPDNVPANGIYRWVIDESSSWTDLGECVTPGTTSATPTRAQLNLTADCTRVQVGYYGIVLSNAEGNPETDAITGGVLYATFYDADGNVTGVARCLNPAQEVACGGADWDYLVEDVNEYHGAFTLEPSSLKICGCLTPDTNARLWAIDDAFYYNGTVVKNHPDYDATLGRLWTYEDCFAKAGPVIVSPADNALVDADPCYCWNDAFTMKWERQCDACSYNLQISRDADFTEVVFEINGKDETTCLENDYDPPSGSTPSYVVANGALGTGSCGTTFYWRVRAADAETGEIIHSWWSEVRSFTVATGPGAALTLTNPSNGAIGVAVTGIPFTWDKVADATGYEFSMVNAETDAEVVAPTAVSGTTYTYTGTLSYNTSYYWTVKALKDSVVFGQATATFTTGAEEAVPIPPTTPAWVWVVIGIGAVLVIVTLVLIFRTRRV